MPLSEQNRSSAFARLAGIAGLLILLVTAIPAQAQTFQVLHNFTGGADGAAPLDGLTSDRHGNLYGTASAGGNQISGCANGWPDVPVILRVQLVGRMRYGWIEQR